MKDIASYEDRLEFLFSRASKIDDDEAKAHWARYLCVLVSGYLEVSMRSILGGHIREKASPRVQRFALSRLAEFQNPKCELICQALTAFDPSWLTAFQGELQDEWKEAVDSVVNNRNQIAHGVDVGITLGTIRRYYDSAKKVVALASRICA